MSGLFGGMKWNSRSALVRSGRAIRRKISCACHRPKHDHVTGYPRLFSAVNNQNTREQFDSMAENVKGDRAGKKGRIHENAFAEGHVKGDGLRAVEPQTNRPIAQR